MDRNDQIRALQEIYSARRAHAEQEAERRLREAEKRLPELKRLREKAGTIVLTAIRAMREEKDPTRRTELAERMRDEGLRNNRAIRECLRTGGYPEDWTEPRYACRLCRDTGLTDEIPAHFCECFERELRMRIYEDGSMAGLKDQCFERFSEDKIRRTNTPEDAERIMAARTVCEAFADRFPAIEKPNLLLYGPGGVGKTFLLNCIFARVIAREQSAVRITAYRLNEVMRNKHIGAEDGDSSFSELLEVPMLLIDDLGTEPFLRNVTVEYLFTLLNERCAARRSTVIATNLGPVELKERYGERVVSRIRDSALCTRIEMRGADLRR